LFDRLIAVGWSAEQATVVTRYLVMATDGPPQPPPYPAEKARGGEIILRRPWQRVVFILGLALPLAVVVLFLFLRH
jgi:hypothetical protein